MTKTLDKINKDSLNNREENAEMGRRRKFDLQAKEVRELVGSLSPKGRKHLLPALGLIIEKVDGYTFYVEKHGGSLYFCSGRRGSKEGESFYSMCVTIEPNSVGAGYTTRLDIHSHTDHESCGVEWNHHKGSGWSVWYPLSALGDTKRFRTLQERMHTLHGNRAIRLGSDLASQLMDCMLRAAAR